MYPVFESIKIEEGHLQQLDYHIARMKRSSLYLWGSEYLYSNLVESIGEIPQTGIHKCKVYYYKNNLQINIEPYLKKELTRIICIKNDEIEYALKYSDREIFNKYQENLESTDDVVFIKNNRLTDASFANVALWNGEEWHTPLYPLLKGTKRAFLLDIQQIKEVDIEVDMLVNYQKISLINSMLDLDESVIDKENFLLTF